MNICGALFTCVIVCSCVCAFCQGKGNKPAPPGDIAIQMHPPLVEPPAAIQRRQTDPRRLEQYARELSDLAGSVPADIDQVNHGKLPKELLDKLKRIERLSKHLRGELGQ